MKQYFFILGRNPLLSCWEVIRAFNLAPDRIIYDSQFLLANFPDSFRPAESLAQLGGIIKVGRIIGKVSKNDLKNKLNKSAIELLQTKKRPVFGLSYYGQDRALRQIVNKVGLSIKQKLKDKGISSRFVVSQQPTLSSVVVTKNKLLSKGAELALLPFGQEIYLGQTEAIQDFEEYSRRDYGRPHRDSRSGMIPPKLAKIMINLAQINKDQLLLDPFCGSGTILQEAALLGYQQLVGSDISAKAVKDTQRNMAWLIEKGKTKFEYKIIETDCRRIFDQVKNIGGIITEPYLGPVNMNPGKLPAVIAQISDLYLRFLKTAAASLPKQAPLVMIWPVWRIGQEEQGLDILDQVKNLGLTPISLNIAGQEKDSVIYQRPGQRVLRQIFVFVKK